jgi:anti-sigma regulatory factor (Ser/Thr protein kinase)
VSGAKVEEARQAALDVILPATPASVARAGALVEPFLAPFGSDRGREIRVAVAEACANVAEHAYSTTDADRTLRLAARASGSALVVLVEDRGHGVRSRHSEPGTGLGMMLIRRLADDARVESRWGGGTSVHMTFELERPGRPVLYAAGGVDEGGRR